VAHSHLEGRGCNKCGLGNNSKNETIWLDQHGIPIEYRQYMIKINSKKYFVDGYCPDTKTIYEYYGDYWHGNPKTTNHSKDNRHKNLSFGELYFNTLKREEVFKQNGYKVNFIWESDFVSDG